MKITDSTVRRAAAIPAGLSDSRFGLSFTARPGDPPRYVDKGSALTFAGHRQAAAFYAGVVTACTATVPAPIQRILDEVTDRHEVYVQLGRRHGSGTPAEHLLDQSEARRHARELNEAGTPAGTCYIAHTYPPGSWGGRERGWTVSLVPTNAT